ncbi:hypothetical protein GCM10009775_11070 [Microbacterium aoyamense]|uniref:IPT/TIG domain-containing protein n=1 Tax=Microbacterium aoyamense TaxID=344166 RepID=A0ABP5AT40_9MICO|nr:hypothetical protein [Microbacterium aoyamense]
MSARIRVAAAAASIALLSMTLAAPAAHAAAGVVVTNGDGASTADPDYATEMTVSGSGFQSITKGFGGVYVLFGWVDDAAGGSWKPSNGGVVGADFRYVPDSESQDNQGFQRFVSFPGSETEGAAHAVMADDGSWTVTMVVPGATFESRDREGSNSSVDCRRVTCGIITIGAHGVKNANNETFTPITFAAPGATGDAAQPDAAAPAIGALRVGLATPVVDAGTSIAFTGQGFTPGEQVVATLDNGLVSVGPLAAGAQGEVAGVLPVPRDVRDGTHVVILTGAASGGVAEAEVVIEVPAALVSTTTGDETPMWVFVVLATSIVLAFALVIVSVVLSIRRTARRRKAARAARPAHTLGAGTAAGPDAETVVLPVTAGTRS